ncbi:LOW QUALITY PROTEIN: putative bromodomain-containing protein 10 [Ciconia maguari]
MLKYQVVLLEQDDVELKTTAIVNPAMFLSTENPMGNLEHDCLLTIEQVYSSRPDLKDAPLPNPDLELFTDGSSFVQEGRRMAGYAVVTTNKILESGTLPANTSAQKAELMALKQALRMAEGKRVNIWTDSKYAFGVIHAHGAIWKERGLLSAQGSLIKHKEEILQLLEDVQKSKEVAGRWYHQKQAVKELHSTLIQLLNELLPWELKLMKAFQRNRSRLKKDYDNFQRQPDHYKFTRELWSNDKSEGDAGKESFEVVTSKSSESVEHEDVSKKDHLYFDEMKLLEMVLPTGKNRLLKRDWTSKEIHKMLPKSVKRQSEQNSCLDDSINELSPRKKAKLSTTEAIVQNSESGMQTDSCLTELKQYEQPTPESFFLSDPATSISNFLKGTKPIQALLAKSIGNKVTLTNRLPPPPGINVSISEKTVISPMESLPIKPALPCQTSSKSPLQTAYKIPGSHYVSRDLHNSSIKIQMQAVIDPKTGEKVMQQVMQPKNFLIQQNEGKTISKNIQSWQQKSPELHCTIFSQAAIVNVSLTPVLVTPTAHATNTLPSTIFNKHIMHVTDN